MALFASTVVQPSNNLIEFSAGKIFLRGKIAHPDPRKGKISIHQSEDGLMHFCWKDATTNNVEDDWIIFPDDAECIRIDKCTTGRVYMLTFKNQARRMLFWMQAFKTDKDEELAKKVNDLLNHPPTPNTFNRTRGADGQPDLNDQMSVMNQIFNASGASSQDIQNALANVDRTQMIQLINGLMGSGGGAGLNNAFLTEPAASATTAAPNPSAARPTATATTPATGAAVSSTPKPTTGGGQTKIDAASFSKILADIGASGVGASKPQQDVQSVAEMLEKSEAKQEGKEAASGLKKKKLVAKKEGDDKDGKKDDPMDLD